MGGIEVTRVSAEDAGRVGSLIGRAFADDPVARWSFGEPPSIEAAFALLAERLYVDFGYSFVAGDRGGTLWAPPDVSLQLGLRAELAMLQRLLRHASLRYVRRADAVGRAMLRHHPPGSHYYLFAIGVRVDARGQGIGGALLKHTLDMVDREGRAAYLENSNPRNTPLYRRFGFEEGEAFEPARGCPPIVPMWRPAQKLGSVRTE